MTTTHYKVTHSYCLFLYRKEWLFCTEETDALSQLVFLQKSFQLLVLPLTASVLTLDLVFRI